MSDDLTVIIGDNRDVLPTLPDRSVHMVVTSPPYFGLRDYGTASWEGGDPECDHDVRRWGGPKQTQGDALARRHCRKCGAHRIDFQVGLEPTPEAYVDDMVAIFRDVRRVLRDDGTVWLNLGDTYAAGSMNGQQGPNALVRHRGNIVQGDMGTRRAPEGLKPKDLIGIPWRVAFALQADGWYLRSDIVWAKPNPMPESVTDRPTKAHEMVFLLSKAERYYFDQEAVREPSDGPWNSAKGFSGSGKRGAGTGYDLALDNQFNGTGTHEDVDQSGRNIRDVWTIATKPYPGAHFATFPEALVEPCVKAGTSERGVCPECGTPWLRVVESHRKGRDWNANNRAGGDRLRSGQSSSDQMPEDYRAPTTIGWRPTCPHYPRVPEWPDIPPIGVGEFPDDHEARIAPIRALRAELIDLWAGMPVVPATVMDIFGGSGTVGRVANKLSRRAILIELNPEYGAQIERRNMQRSLFL